MICLQGKTVCGGIISGETFVFKRNAVKSGAENKSISAFDELNKLEFAIRTVKENLDVCISQSKNTAERDVFEIHRMMLEDEDFLTYLKNAVQNGATAVEAVFQTEHYFSEIFLNTQDDYMISRIDDIRDVCGRLSATFTAENNSVKPQKPAVIVANELLPSDLVEIGKENIAGIIMGSGTVFSHTSILIKEMGVPAIICEDISAVKSGMTVILNGESGVAYIEPDDSTVEDFNRSTQFLYENKKTSAFNKLQCKLYVNIGNVREVDGCLFEKCDGIGLFRTEYLYIGRPDLPNEEEQFSVYKNILEKANGKCVTVRTFDIGSDKSVSSLSIKNEENPALGLRGLRLYFLYPDVFKTQLKALLRAAVYGNLRIMYPMVTSCQEIEKIKQILLQAKKELSQQGIPFKLPPQGAMIETPAAALLSEDIAKTVDFFSVGTNDLLQYTFAVDRQNGELDAFCNQNYKAIMSLIKIATENAHNKGIEIGICGELASVMEFIPKWTELGIDYISVAPSVLK